MVTRYSMTQHKLTPTKWIYQYCMRALFPRQDVADELFRISRVPSLAATNWKVVCNIAWKDEYRNSNIEGVNLAVCFSLVSWLKCVWFQPIWGANCQWDINPKMAKHNAQQPIACKAALFRVYSPRPGVMTTFWTLIVNTKNQTTWTDNQTTLTCQRLCWHVLRGREQDEVMVKKRFQLQHGQISQLRFCQRHFPLLSLVFLMKLRMYLTISMIYSNWSWKNSWAKSLQT